MDLSVLKTPGFWAAVIAALLGVVLSQHVVADSSLPAAIIGWVLTFLGAGTAGHQVAAVTAKATAAS